MKGLLDDAGDVVGVLDQVAVLGEGGHRASDIHLLEDIPPQQIAGYLAGDGYHGDGIHIGGGDAGDQVGGARAGGHHAHPHLPADPGIAGGHMARVLLRADQGVADLRVGLQGVHRRADGGAGIAEDMRYLFPLQTLDQGLCSCHEKITSKLHAAWAAG